MNDGGYVPSYKALNAKARKASPPPALPPKTLFMAPVFVKRHESAADRHPHGDGALPPTKDADRACCKPCAHHIPKETYTQTSKTILQLAQMEQLHASCASSLRRRVGPPLPHREPGLDGGDGADHGDDERFSVDSLNLREEPEKENPIHPVKASRDLQEFIDMRDAKDVRLHQWVRSISRNRLSGSATEAAHSPGRAGSTVGVVSLHGRSKYSLHAPSRSTAPRTSATASVNALNASSATCSLDISGVLAPSRKVCNFRDVGADDAADLRNASGSVSMDAPRHGRRITSFHNLIHLNDAPADCEALVQPSPGRQVALDSDRAGASARADGVLALQDGVVAGAGAGKLDVWHSQIQYGPSSSSSDQYLASSYRDREHFDDHGDAPQPIKCPAPGAPGRKQKRGARGQHLRSRSLIECDRVRSGSRCSTPMTPQPVFKKISRMSNARSRGSSQHQRKKFECSSLINAAQHIQQCYQSHAGAAMCKKSEVSSFMSPTLSSEQKSLKQQVESVKWLMGNKFKAASPNAAKMVKEEQADIPYTHLKTRIVKSEELGSHAGKAGDGKIPSAFSSSTLFGSASSCDNGLFLLLNRIKSPDFNKALKALAEIIDTAKHTSVDVVMPYMTLVNQRLLELLKSPRSHVARTACQLTGHFFEVMKDTRRPEFDDIINTLLYKTADASKFIRQDANLALDAMVTHIPIFHAVRSVCAKGPTHRNPLVRCAAVRLIICAVVIAGPAAVMNFPNHEATRKRIIENLSFFLDDKNGDTRKYAERLYKILHKEGTFVFFAKKYLNRTKHEALMGAVKNVSKKPS